MRPGRHSIVAISLGLFLAAGCGGGSSSAPASNEPSSAPSAAASDAGSSQGTTTSAEPSAEPSSGGGSTAGVCELVTPDEMSGILGVSVTMQVLQGVGGMDTCDIQSDGAPAAAFVLTRSNPSAGLDVSFVFAAYETSSSWTSVSGIGDKAGFDSSQVLLVVLKGDAMVSIAVLDDSLSDDQRLDEMKRIGTIAAGRM